MQITKPLDISEQQLAQLDLHSFLNILNILMGELQLLKLDLNDAAALPETTQLANEVLQLVRAGRLDAEASRQAITLQSAFLKEWSGVLRRSPDNASQPPLSEAAANLDSILKVMVVRIGEYQ